MIEVKDSPLLLEEPLSIGDWKERSIDFIQNGYGSFTGEGYTDTCKFDNKQNSWGHGTACKTIGDKINKEEADKQFASHLNPLYEVVDNSCYNDNQKIALVSYMYNTGGYQMNLRSYIKRCSHKDITYIMSVWGWNAEYPGLKSRRETELYFYNI